MRFRYYIKFILYLDYIKFIDLKLWKFLSSGNESKAFFMKILVLYHHSSFLLMLTLPVPNLDEEKKSTQNFIFTLCGVSKGFMKGLHETF